MINPLFATMLSFLFTDCSVQNEQLTKLMPALGRDSFERITVDGDTSTNDTVMVFSRRRGEPVCDMAAFREKLLSVMKELAFLIVRDGEGATKVIHITVAGAQKREVAEKLARRISVSPLVKTAFFGCDPNWGRIIAAAGDAGVPIRPEKVEIVMQGERLALEGVEVPFSEEKLKRLMDKKEIELVVDLHDGKAAYDLLHDRSYLRLYQDKRILPHVSDTPLFAPGLVTSSSLLLDVRISTPSSRSSSWPAPCIEIRRVAQDPR